MKTYRIQYFFEGSGSCGVEAKNKENAEELFFDGGILLNMQEDGQNYEIDKIEVMKQFDKRQKI